jgi:uncharacterized protein YdaU (DUF1376 family)
MHYYQFHIGDYASHTRHLSLIEDIAYRRLLDFYYLHEQPIRQRDIARQIGMRDQEQDVLTVLNEFFVSTDAGFVSPRADKEIQHYHSKVEQASKAGKASAERRSNVRSTDVQPTINHKPITINQEPVTKVEKKQRGSRLPTDFEVPDDWISFCQTERPDLHPHKIFDGFKDYWVAAPKGVKLDWTATWRNWVRNQKTEKVQESFFERDQKLKRERMKEFTPHVAGLKKIDPNTGFFIEEISDVYALTSR